MALLLVLCLEVHFYELFIILKVKKEKKQHLRHVSCLEQQHICLDSLAKF